MILSFTAVAASAAMQMTFWGGPTRCPQQFSPVALQQATSRVANVLPLPGLPRKQVMPSSGMRSSTAYSTGDGNTFMKMGCGWDCQESCV